jgi:soluble lytic murein transglycosylase-like protein
VWLFFTLIAAIASGQDRSDVRGRQELAAAKQRDAARVQAGMPEAKDAFFTVPFSNALPAPPSSSCEPADRKAVDSLISSAAQREGIKRELLQAVVETESGFDSCAASHKGAQGLMQLMPEVQKEFGVEDPFDAEKNISAGAGLLKRLLGEFKGDLKLALAAYNSGSARVAESKGVPDIPETRDYVERILTKLSKRDGSNADGKPPP